MPSHSPRAAPSLIGASRTAPPPTLPSIMRGLETAALVTLSGCVGIDLQVGPMKGDGLAGAIAHNADHRRVAGLRLPVRQVVVRQKIGAVRDGKPAAAQIGCRRRAGERDRVIQNEGDLARGVAFRLRRGGDGSWRTGAPGDQPTIRRRSANRSRPVSPVDSSSVLSGPPPWPPSKSCQSPARSPFSAMTQEPFLRGAAPLMLASRHSSPTRRPLGKSRGTQVSAVARSRATMASRS